MIIPLHYGTKNSKNSAAILIALAKVEWIHATEASDVWRSCDCFFLVCSGDSSKFHTSSGWNGAHTSSLPSGLL